MKNPYYQPSTKDSELVQTQYAIGHLCAHSTQALSHVIDVAAQFNANNIEAVLGDIVLLQKDLDVAKSAVLRLRAFAPPEEPVVRSAKR